MRFETLNMTVRLCNIFITQGSDSKNSNQHVCLLLRSNMLGSSESNAGANLAEAIARVDGNDRPNALAIERNRLPAMHTILNA